VSVVVPTCRRPEMLRRCLEALCAQDLPPADFEVIVVDDGPTAATARAVAEIARAAPMPVRYLADGGGRGPAAARNRGWRVARGAIVAFTDDDCVPAPEWLREGLAAFRGGVVGVAGRVELPLPPHPTDYERDAARLGEAAFVTANCFCRREALLAVGGFDERFRVPWREDSDLQFALQARGGRLVQAPAARVLHPIRPAPWGVSLSQQRKSEYNALLYKKHPARYRQEIQAAPPWRYYATVAAAGLALGGAAAGRRALAAGGGLAWAALTVQFCAQRLAGTTRRPTHVAEMLVTSALIPPLAVYWRLRGALRFRVTFL
jgi:GT2 family glycosyltransferase